MPVQGSLPRSLGSPGGERRLYAETIQAQDGAEHETPFDDVQFAWAENQNGDNVATVTDTADGTLTLSLVAIGDGTAVNADEAVTVYAIEA